MTFCSLCGYEEISDKSFCSKCGEKLQVFDNKDKPLDDNDKSHKEPYPKFHAPEVIIIIVIIFVALMVVWVFTGNDEETVYTEFLCDYLYNLGTIYQEKGVFGNENIAMTDYRENC